MKAAIKRIILCAFVFVLTFSTLDVNAQAASKKSYTSSDLRYLTAIVYCEAGSESYKGKVAVANVVLNRVNNKKYPNTIKSVIYQKGQFTPARSGSLKKALAKYDGKSSMKSSEKKMMAESKKAAKAALNGKKVLSSKYLFFTGYRSKKTIQKKYKNAVFIGNHYFR